MPSRHSASYHRRRGRMDHNGGLLKKTVLGLSSGDTRSPSLNDWRSGHAVAMSAMISGRIRSKLVSQPGELSSPSDEARDFLKSFRLKAPLQRPEYEDICLFRLLEHAHRHKVSGNEASHFGMLLRENFSSYNQETDEIDKWLQSPQTGCHVGKSMHTFNKRRRMLQAQNPIRARLSFTCPT